jgi:hypothetical protein
MLIIALIAAFVLYIGLYFFWESAQVDLSGATAIAITLRDMIFSMPQSQPLALLKWGLIIFAFYLVGDGILSLAKGGGRTNSRRSARRR